MNHKVKINNIEVELTEEQIIELHSRLQNNGEKYFFPKEGDDYYFAHDIYGNIIDNKNTGGEIHCGLVSRGVFRTEEQAKKEDEKRKALVRMWKWVQENGLYFEPNWSDNNIIKYFPKYSHKLKQWSSNLPDVEIQYNFLFPYFKSQSDCQKFIDNNLSDLNLFV